MKKQGVLVTTKHRGVFFGYITKKPTKLPGHMELTDARMCVYWSSDVKGVLGLASGGPTKNCRITNSVPKIDLWDVTSITECSQEAVKAWETNIWGN